MNSTGFARGWLPRRRIPTGVVALSVGLGLAACLVAAAAYRRSQSRQRGVPPELYVDRTVIVNKTPLECYEFWQDLSNIPRFTPRLQRVTVGEDAISHWLMSLPGGGTVEWDSRTTVDRPGERLSWRSVSDEPFSHAGSVRFEAAPGGRGTFVTVTLHYRAPGGVLGAGLARMLGPDPFGELREDLRRFKQLIETGEIPTTAGQPSGRRSWLGRKLREGRTSRQPESAPRESGNKPTFRREGTGA